MAFVLAKLLSSSIFDGVIQCDVASIPDTVAMKSQCREGAVCLTGIAAFFFQHRSPVVVLVVGPGREEIRRAVGEGGKAKVPRQSCPYHGTCQTDRNLTGLRGVLAPTGLAYAKRRKPRLDTI